MTYFSKFPTLLTQVGDVQQTVEDFFIRVSAGSTYTTVSALLTDYTVLDGERPEDVAYKFYNSMDYFWVILLINSIVDPRNEWPMLDQDILTFTTIKYGLPYAIHHWETVDGQFEISPYQSLVGQGTIVSVTNYDYELRVNEAKRSIKVLDAQYLTEFVSDFTAALGS